MWHVRDLDDSAFAAAGALMVDAYPHRAHEPGSWARPDPIEQPSRWGAFDASASALIGYAALWRVRLNRFRFDVVVQPDQRRRGLGRDLFARVLREAGERDAATLQARAYASCEDAMRFLRTRAFNETMRMYGFVLDLADVNISALPTDPARGVSIAEVTEAHIGDDRFWQTLTDLQAAASEGWPDPDPGGPQDPVSTTLVRGMLIPSGRRPLAFFVAYRGDECVGYSALAARRTRPDEAQFAMTAVRPDCRNAGIATALRARCLAVAKERGYRAVRSSSGNLALIRINAQFGFREVYCEVRLVKTLRASSPLPACGERG